MNTRADLATKRELLLIGLHARRLGLARRSHTALAIARNPDYPRSAVMRFVYRQPHVCLWLVSELLPLLSGKKVDGSFKRLTQALYADLYPVAIRL